jgi:hypothetical protein
MTRQVNDEMVQAAVREFGSAPDLALAARLQVSIEAALRHAGLPTGHDDDCTREKPGYVYVASSWRTPLQIIRAAGIDCYDFKNPEGSTGFSWSEIDPDWMNWTAEQYVAALEHPAAIRGYKSDMDAMIRADTFVLVLPCGRSAHLELGWAAGQGKRTAIFTQDGQEPELMAKMCDLITPSTMDLLSWLGVED